MRLIDWRATPRLEFLARLTLAGRFDEIGRRVFQPHKSPAIAAPIEPSSPPLRTPPWATFQRDVDSTEGLASFAGIKTRGHRETGAGGARRKDPSWVR